MRRIGLFCLFYFFCSCAAVAGGGMYPLSMLGKMGLKEKGLRISLRDIYNPQGEGGIVRAIVQIGGCTGSFVSDKGLIITNHHCVAGALRAYGDDLYVKGYLAKNRKAELPIKGLSCRILESYEDVSQEVLKNTFLVKDALLRKQIIESNIKGIVEREYLYHTGYEISVTEMISGQRYDVFRYKRISDLRIVYIPPKDIGEFGGQTDNWEWPRQGGDFAFIRAYVSSSGKECPFDSANVPYEPEEYLNVSSKGISKGDFIFIAGYPGRTFRNRPSSFLHLQAEYLLPYISHLYKWEINAMQKAGQHDSVWLHGKLGQISSLGNVAKNFSGKIKGFNNLPLIAQREKEEAQISSSLPLKESNQFQNILGETDSLYTLSEKSYLQWLWYGQIFSRSHYLGIAGIVANMQQNYASHKKKDSSLAMYLSRLRNAYRRVYPPYDSAYFRKMLNDGHKMGIAALQPVDNGWLQKMYTTSLIFDSSRLMLSLHKHFSKFLKHSDEIATLYNVLHAQFIRTDSIQRSYQTAIDRLLPQYVGMKMEAQDGQLIPDANLTLRISYGYVKGYRPEDGVYAEPFTTIDGMLAKGRTDNPDYQVNDELRTAWQSYVDSRKPVSSYLPICLLYDADTTGGNSGSPVLNKYGQLIGINFDRPYEGTINDYAWNEKYSRAIGVDIRFVIWTLRYVAHANYIVNEMFLD